MLKSFPRWALTLIGLLGVLSSISDILSRFLNIGLPGVVAEFNLVVRLTVSWVSDVLNWMLTWVPGSILPDALPDGYVSAMLLSVLVSTSYSLALAKTDVIAGKAVYWQRKFVAPVVVVIFSLSLIGLSLILTLLRNALKDEKELSLALQTFFIIGKIVAGATFVSLFFVLFI